NVPDLDGDPEGTYLTDRLTDVTIDFLTEHQEEPFFFVLSHYAVHTPLQAKPEVTARYADKAEDLGPVTEADYEAEREAETKLRQDHPTYAAMIESTDQSVGRILDALDDLELWERTIVMFVSDNGGLSTLMRRSPTQATSNLPLRAGKGWLYEGGIRAPLIVRTPGVPAGGLVSDHPASSTDLYPTLLALAGLPARPEQHVDGVSLAAALTAGEAARDTLYWHFPHYHGSGNRPGGAIRAGNFKLVEWFEDGSVELYDLATDLSEDHDLATERPEDTQRLQDRLHAWRAKVGANMPTARN
ncbi:MAG: sulfatase-like hydrolase/transferase, partial [Gemmatimonadales bacterium]|nr:sulfatase-like hydrolase/transferase [Gemmatimonadales bacterium]